MSHGHSHGKTENIKTAITLNVVFTIIEIIGGLWTNSLAILSDALHDFGDSVALIVSLYAEKKANKSPDVYRTFGYQRLSLFSGLFVAVVLVVGSLFILSEAIPRLLNPEHVNASGMIALAVVGIAFNGIAFFRVRRGSSINERVISWHMLEDVMGWGVILVGSVIILFWDNHLIDPIMTIGYTLFILWGVTRSLKEVVNILLQGVPQHINLNAMTEELSSIDGVSDIHDVHVWSLEGETDVFTAHFVVDDEYLYQNDEIKVKIKDILRKHHIEHSTIEIESDKFCSGIECDNKNTCT